AACIILPRPQKRRRVQGCNLKTETSIRMRPLRQLYVIAAFCAAASVATAALAQDEIRLGKPLPGAHAHNDYEHARPLLDALEHGFCGIEADIHLRNGELLVGHDPEDLAPERTLEKLYLRPLNDLVKENGGRVYPGGP